MVSGRGVGVRGEDPLTIVWVEICATEMLPVRGDPGVGVNKIAPLAIR